VVCSISRFGASPGRGSCSHNHLLHDRKTPLLLFTPSRKRRPRDETRILDRERGPKPRPSYATGGSTFTLRLDQGAFGKAATVTLLVAVVFGLLVLWFARYRIGDVPVPTFAKVATCALGVAAIILALACMFIYTPEAMAYEDSRTESLAAMSSTPRLRSGGFVTIAGVLMGALVVVGARGAGGPRRDRDDQRPTSARRRNPLRAPTAAPVEKGSPGPPKLLR
jgi:hypothetical protein